MDRIMLNGTPKWHDLGIEFQRIFFLLSACEALVNGLTCKNPNFFEGPTELFVSTPNASEAIVFWL
jgi:hypothetical protein